MSVTVVVGGQFGSEGKGKICAHLAITDNVNYMVRCGGPNSGHTVDVGGVRYQLRQVPSGFVNPNARLLIAPGALVDPGVFIREVELCGLTPERIGIDKNAGVIDQIDVDAERELDLSGRLGSTGSGVGSAVSRRVLRDPSFRLAANHPALAPFVTSVRDELAGAVRQDESIIVEGTQGFGLSLYHAEEWPYRTSRDTTAHSFLGEVGLGVRDYDVIMAIRTYPIRVAGNSGPLPDEITWEDIQRESGYPHPIAEYTTTTKRLRRVARFDWSVVDQAVAANSPTQIALHGADYIDYANINNTEWHQLTPELHGFVNTVERRYNKPITFIGTGTANEHIVDRRGSSNSWTASVFSFAHTSTVPTLP
jgi:adenylosuccinate synthase